MTPKVHRLRPAVKPVTSWTAVECARAVPGLYPSQKAVLVRLAEHMNPANGGRVWPTVPQIMKATGFVRSTVQRALRALEAAGYIHTMQPGGRFKGRKYGTLYEVDVVALRNAARAVDPLYPVNVDVVPIDRARAEAEAEAPKVVGGDPADWRETMQDAFEETIDPEIEEDWRREMEHELYLASM